jgi:LacI family transcriptional regulator
LINKKRITIADVAQKAGVSKQTVSRVINERPDVAPETRERIKALIRSMGYTPDPIARSMKGSTHTLGCITPNLSDYNFSAIVQAAQSEARHHGYFVLTGSAQSEIDVPPLLNEMLDRRVDGLLVINPRDDNRYRHLLPVIEAGIPIVYIKNTPVDEAVSAVCLDDFTGGYLACQYLISLGHKSIVTILGPENEECTKKRLAGFTKALLDVGSETDQRLIIQGDWSAKSGKSAINKLLAYQVEFSAIFAQNDRMALGAMRSLREAGMRIPQDISVVGYDDLPLTSYYDPPLTTVRQPIEKFGQVGIRLLLDVINKPGTAPQVVNLNPTLIIRETCAFFHSS